MIPLHEHPSLRYALHLAGHDHFHDAPFLLALRDALEGFVRAPRPLNIDADPVLGEAIMGWLALRLVGGHMGIPLPEGLVTTEQRPSLLAPAAPIVLRWTPGEMAPPSAQAEQLAEAWYVASALYAREPPALFVSLSHDAPTPELPPGELIHTRAGYGFRLRKVEPLRCGEVERDILAWIFSADARETFAAAMPAKRARFIAALDALADYHALDPWTVVPLLSRVGDLLPASLQRRFRARMPRAVSPAAQVLDQAGRRLNP